ncbi:hypothetical protein [Streptosporangium vulgare]|uniref:hypothetical protein n=1 Tax=Streptosporangium vulgare TaxID=46190 RepID=UPI0031DE061A
MRCPSPGRPLRGAPWKTAAVVGGATATTVFVLSVFADGGDLPWAMAIGIGLCLAHRGHRLDQQARRRRPGDPGGTALGALRHPWRFALYPALGSAILLSSRAARPRPRGRLRGGSGTRSRGVSRST